MAKPKSIKLRSVTKTTDSFRIVNKGHDTAEIHIDGFIGGGFFEMDDDGSKEFKIARANNKIAMRNELQAISNIGAENILVHIDSMGGFVDHALAMHDLLAAHPADVTVRITGMTASSATVIAQAGDTIEMSDNALFLIHRVTGGAVGNADNVRDESENIQRVEDRLVNIYKKSNRGGSTKAQIVKLMAENDGQGIWLSAKEAKKLGFIDTVFEPMAMAAAVTNKQRKLTNLPKIGKTLNTNIMNIKDIKVFVALIAEKLAALVDDDNTEEDILENIADAAECEVEDLERILDEDVEAGDTMALTAFADEFDMTLNELLAEANGDEDPEDPEDPEEEEEEEGGEEGLMTQIANWWNKTIGNKKVTRNELKKHSKTLAKKLQKQFKAKIEKAENDLETAKEKHKKAIARKNKEIKNLTQKVNGKGAKSLKLKDVGDADLGGDPSDTGGQFLAALKPSQRQKLKDAKKKRDAAAAAA